MNLNGFKKKCFSFYSKSEWVRLLNQRLWLKGRLTLKMKRYFVSFVFLRTTKGNLLGLKKLNKIEKIDYYKSQNVLSCSQKSLTLVHPLLNFTWNVMRCFWRFRWKGSGAVHGPSLNNFLAPLFAKVPLVKRQHRKKLISKHNVNFINVEPSLCSNWVYISALKFLFFRKTQGLSVKTPLAWLYLLSFA